MNSFMGERNTFLVEVYCEKAHIGGVRRRPTNHDEDFPHLRIVADTAWSNPDAFLPPGCGDSKVMRFPAEHLEKFPLEEQIRRARILAGQQPGAVWVKLYGPGGTCLYDSPVF